MTTALANMIIEQQEAKKALKKELDGARDSLNVALGHNRELLTLIEIMRRDIVPDQYFNAAVAEARGVIETPRRSLDD